MMLTGSEATMDHYSSPHFVVIIELSYKRFDPFLLRRIKKLIKPVTRCESLDITGDSGGEIITPENLSESQLRTRGKPETDENHLK